MPTTRLTLAPGLLLAAQLCSTSIAAYAQSAKHVLATPTACHQGVTLCVAGKREEFRNRGTLEMLIHPIVAPGDPNFGYWRVVEVFPRGVAEAAGLKDGDLIVKWNEKDLPRDNPRFLEPRLASVKIDEEIRISVMRSGKLHQYSLKASKPDETTMEYWLLTYVKNNFSDAEFREYSSRVTVQLIKAPKG